jgi:hypothetical protein
MISRYELTFVGTDTSPDNGDDDVDDIKENRGWLRDMLFYFSARFGRAHDLIGYYPYQDSHIKYPYPRNALVASGWRHF